MFRIKRSFISSNPHTQKDFYKWRATVFHCDNRVISLTRQFVENDDELALFQIVGHSYDLDVEDRWDVMEKIFKMISEQDNILPMTTIEITDYLKAMDKAEITDRYIRNNSDISLWFDINGNVCEVKANCTARQYLGD